jgi:hypothetical protein
MILEERGVVSALSKPLAEFGLSMLYVSSYETSFIMVH